MTSSGLLAQVLLAAPSDPIKAPSVDLTAVMPVLIVLGVILSLLLGVMFKMSQSELAPEDDQGIVLSFVTGPPTATADQMPTHAHPLVQAPAGRPQYHHVAQTNAVPKNQAAGFIRAT